MHSTVATTKLWLNTLRAPHRRQSLEENFSVRGVISEVKVRLNFFQVTTRNFEVCMKQSHDSSDDNKFAVTANEPLSEQTDVFMSLLSMSVIVSETTQTQKKLFFNILVFCAMTIT